MGAGPAGLMLACLLSKYHVPFVIIDKKKMISDHIKACMLSSRSLEIFSKLGLLDQAMTLGELTDTFEIYLDKKRIVSLDYRSVEAPFPFNLHLGQPYTEKILHGYLIDHAENVLWEHELIRFTQDEKGVCATISHQNETKTIHAAFLIGADGASSLVRKRCDLTFEGNTYTSHFLLGNVKCDWDLPRNVARLFLGDFGFLSVHSLPDQQMQIGGNVSAPTPNQATPDINTLKTLFEERCIFPGKIHDLKWLSYYRTHCRYIKKRILNRVIMMGDAAQIISPLTGLGMNAGIQDAENLASKLALIYQNKADQQLLLTYQEERYCASKKLSSFSNVLEEVYTIQNKQSKSLRNYMLKNLAMSPEIQKKEVARLLQKDLSYR